VDDAACCRLLSALKDVEKARKRKRTRKPKIYQTRPWLIQERRRLYGHDDRLKEELRVEDPQSFYNYIRMEPAMYNELVQRVRPKIEKHDTNMRKAFRLSLE